MERIVPRKSTRKENKKSVSLLSVPEYQRHLQEILYTVTPYLTSSFIKFF